jgi:hypothetical protein
MTVSANSTKITLATFRKDFRVSFNSLCIYMNSPYFCRTLSLNQTNPVRPSITFQRLPLLELKTQSCFNSSLVNLTIGVRKASKGLALKAVKQIVNNTDPFRERTCAPSRGSTNALAFYRTWGAQVRFLNGLVFESESSIVRSVDRQR